MKLVFKVWLALLAYLVITSLFIPTLLDAFIQQSTTLDTGRPVMAAWLLLFAWLGIPFKLVLSAIRSTHKESHA